MEISLISGVSLFSSIASIVLAIVAIILGISSRKESRENYDNSTKTLAEVDKKSAVIEKAITENYQLVLSTLTGTLQKIIDSQMPQRIPPEMQMMFEFVSRSPEMMETMKEALKKGIEKGRENK